MVTKKVKLCWGHNSQACLLPMASYRSGRKEKIKQTSSEFTGVRANKFIPPVANTGRHTHIHTCFFQNVFLFPKSCWYANLFNGQTSLWPVSWLRTVSSKTWEPSLWKLINKKDKPRPPASCGHTCPQTPHCKADLRLGYVRPATQRAAFHLCSGV